MITPLMQQAMEAVATLPEEDQNIIAKRLLDALQIEDAFDQKLVLTSPKLVGLAEEALLEFQSGKTLKMEFEPS